jgi:hypothetical protein
MEPSKPEEQKKATYNSPRLLEKLDQIACTYQKLSAREEHILGQTHQ